MWPARGAFTGTTTKTYGSAVSGHCAKTSSLPEGRRRARAFAAWGTAMIDAQPQTRSRNSLSALGSPLRRRAHRRPDRRNVRFLRRERADRDAHHPAAVEHRGRQIGRARAVDALRPTRACGDRAPRPRGRAARGGRRPSAGEPARARASPASRATWSASHRALSRSRRRRACNAATPWSRIRHQSFSARKRRPSGMPQSRRFLTCAVGRGLQVARVGGHHPDEMLRVADVVERAVERGAEPLVRVEHQRVGALDALPHPAALGQDHRRARHRRVDVQPEAVRRAISAIAPIGSIAVDVVVPVVATTAHGVSALRADPRRSPPRARPARMA